MFLKTIFVLLATSSSLCYVESQFLPGRGYHERVGIPKATLLRWSEGSYFYERIVGGKPVTDDTDIPHQAGLIVTLTTGLTSICGGAVVSQTRVLTAAHCWFDGQNQAKQFTVVLGSLKIFSGGTRIMSSDVTLHPAWNTKDIINDIAVIKINKVQFSTKIKAISLPQMADVNLNFAGMAATVSGFGKTSDAQITFPQTTSLQHLNLNIISNAECQKSFEVSIHGSHICTSGLKKVGTCDGDSGGPLTVLLNKQKILVGIVSFGLGDACQSGYPSVYTRVTAFLPWIQGQL